MLLLLMKDTVENQKPEKVTKTLKLSSSISEKLDVVSDELGLSVHSYLCSELSKAINRDFISINSLKVAEEQSRIITEYINSNLEKL